MPFPAEGGCLCGAIRYRLAAAPLASMHSGGSNRWSSHAFTTGRSRCRATVVTNTLFAGRWANSRLANSIMWVLGAEPCGSW